MLLTKRGSSKHWICLIKGTLNLKRQLFKKFLIFQCVAEVIVSQFCFGWYGVLVGHIKDITAENIKLRPLVSTFGTCYCQEIKTLAPLIKNKYTIKETLDFANRFQDCTLENDETLVLVSNDVSSLFTEVPLNETINNYHGQNLWIK